MIIRSLPYSTLLSLVAYLLPPPGFTLLPYMPLRSLTCCLTPLFLVPLYARFLLPPSFTHLLAMHPLSNLVPHSLALHSML